MLRFSCFIIAIICFSACHRPSGIKEVISGADSVAISYYTGNGKIDSVTKVIILRKHDEMEKLATYIESDQVAQNNCGYDGALHFFKSNTVIKPVYFRSNDVNCMHFSFMMDGNSFFTKLSPEAKQFLQTTGAR